MRQLSDCILPFSFVLAWGAVHGAQSWLDSVAAREQARLLWASGVGGVNPHPMHPLSLAEGGAGDGESEGRHVDLRWAKPNDFLF
jgi:hypothetical protein